jgi:hypothetical protein
VANPLWPSGLPQEVYTDSGPTYDSQDNTIRSSVTSGPAKMRRRFTAVPADVTVGLQLSEAEIAILETFVKTTLGEVLPFDWVNFHTGATVSYLFKAGWSSVKLTWYVGDIWTVSMALEQLP